MLRGRIGPRLNMAVLSALVVGFVIAMNYPAFRGWAEVPPVRYMNVPFPVQGTVHPGQVIPVYIERCNSSPDPVTYVVARSLYRIDSQGNATHWLSLDELHVEIPPGCANGLSRLHVFPKDYVGEKIESGTYVLEGTAIIKTEWTTHYVPWKTQPFTVVANGN